MLPLSPSTTRDETHTPPVIVIPLPPDTSLAHLTDGTVAPVEVGKPVVKLSTRLRWTLLSMYSLAMFIDVWSWSAFFIFIDEIANDLGIVPEQRSWIITSYSVTFASFLLFWGRVVDLYSPRITFVYGFLVLALLNLINSFLPDKYSWFVVRSISGIAGSALIPASYSLITSIFEGKELDVAMTFYGASGAVASATGLVFSGVIDLIPGEGQMKAWRWFFRIVAAIIFPFALVALWIVPEPIRTEPEFPLTKKWKRLDLVGSVLMLAATTAVILSLTFGASYGWRSVSFILPLILAFLLYPAFFIWEAKIPTDMALLPPSIWKIPNLTCLVVSGLFVYGYFSINFLVFASLYIKVHLESTITTAVRILPEGIASIITCFLLTAYPRYVSKPRWPIVSGLLLGIASLLLWIYSSERVGTAYWKYIFTGMVIGTIGIDVAFTGINVGVIRSVPPEISGVAGGLLQVSFQAGSTIALAIQAGLLTVYPGEIENWRNVQVSFWFELAWAVVWLVGFLCWYRPAKEREVEDGVVEGVLEKGKEEGGGEGWDRIES